MGMTINGTSGLVFPDATTMVTGAQAVKAWVNFNGTGTVAIRAAYNVTSITDNSVGNYTVNFTTALPDANYAANSTNTTATGAVSTSIQSPTTTTLGVISYLSGAATDQAIVCVSVFR